MKSIFDRRAFVFFAFAGVAALLVEPCPEDFRWIGKTLSIVYLVLGAMSWMDYLSRTWEKWIDKRAIVFIAFAAIASLLVEPCPEDFRWIGKTLTVVYLVLAGMSWLDMLLRWTSGRTNRSR